MEKHKKPKMSDFEKHEENPFLDKLVTDMPTKRRKKWVSPTNTSVVETVINGDGEVTGGSSFFKYDYYDDATFTKFFVDGMRLFFNLSTPASKVLSYVAIIAPINQDKFMLFPEECMEKMAYKTPRLVFDGLAELLEKGIIARARRVNQYYLNPQILFNGDRVVFAAGAIRERIKKKISSDTSQLELTFDPDSVGYDGLRKNYINHVLKKDKGEIENEDN